MAGLPLLDLENVRIGFRNFEGREGVYNKSGERSFVVFIEEELAERLARDGWNVKFPKPHEGGDPDDMPRQPYLPIAVGFDNFPAKVVQIVNGHPTRLTPEEVGMLDWSELESVDLVIRPREWSSMGKTGVKAYLKAGYFTLESDRFSSKYGI